jgi:hypothetical protein
VKVCQCGMVDMAWAEDLAEVVFMVEVEGMAGVNSLEDEAFVWAEAMAEVGLAVALARVEALAGIKLSANKRPGK